MKNLFDVLKPNVFSIFARGDKRSNYNLLAHLYSYLSTRQTVLKDELIDDLTEYIRNNDFADFDDDEGNDIADRSAKEKANLKYRQFKKCGWIEEGTTEGFSMSVSMDENAIILLDAFYGGNTDMDLIPIEGTGFVLGTNGVDVKKTASANDKSVMVNTAFSDSSFDGGGVFIKADHYVVWANDADSFIRGNSSLSLYTDAGSFRFITIT